MMKIDDLLAATDQIHELRRARASIAAVNDVPGHLWEISAYLTLPGDEAKTPKLIHSFKIPVDQAKALVLQPLREREAAAREALRAAGFEVED